jgi:ribosome biogenesis GTPase A
MASLDDKKAAIRAALTDLAAAAEAAGLPWVARDVRDTRLPKLEDERFSVVVLGEFNHGKSTFINALLGTPLLPTGITPTTALLAHVTHGARAGATAVTENGDRTAIDAASLADHLTVEGLAKAAGKSGTSDGKPRQKARRARRRRRNRRPRFHHVEITHPSPLLANRLTIVDTPGVNDINEQRATSLRIPAARGRGRVPAGRDADPDRVGAPVPGGAHPPFHARPADLRGREGRPARRGGAG